MVISLAQKSAFLAFGYGICIAILMSWMFYVIAHRDGSLQYSPSMMFGIWLFSVGPQFILAIVIAKSTLRQLRYYYAQVSLVLLAGSVYYYTIINSDGSLFVFVPVAQYAVIFIAACVLSIKDISGVLVSETKGKK